MSNIITTILIAAFFVSVFTDSMSTNTTQSRHELEQLDIVIRVLDKCTNMQHIDQCIHNIYHPKIK